MKIIFYSNAESTAYEFGTGTGLVTFQYPEGRWPDTHRDLLALGFMTHQQDDATILRLDSANSNDFMELEIVSIHQPKILVLNILFSLSCRVV